MRCWTTQSVAARSWETSTTPPDEPTLIEVSFALVAMPLSPTVESLPTMMPAMCVPWPNES